MHHCNARLHVKRGWVHACVAKKGKVKGVVVCSAQQYRSMDLRSVGNACRSLNLDPQRINTKK